jgi:hypothetical protein
MQTRLIKNSLMKILFSVIMLVAVYGCGRDAAYLLPPQVWNDTEFLVEIRPGAPRVGMNEFVVLSTQTDGAPGYNYVITIKTNLSDSGSQMIQDGHSGVYRRAIEVKDPANEVLVVQIIHKKETELKTELKYPLSKHL